MSIRKMERHERRRRRKIQGLQTQVHALIADLEERRDVEQARASFQPQSMTAAKYLAIAFVAFLGVLLAASALPRFVFYFLSL
jgi:hypothetical protein